ncbi:unnamed protein product [Didymodactylos carnosus]|uniref:EF-hand domain-containing protein n=1 Tax=Didymodactylos carnosus TaxID=1234261 RepID=A0A8S2J192_9BILA|nr:unnamed protein product [Didymodactylos carnosus]CAF3788885.1 unnamed protein product [Didymodactylos carnosus]
MAAWNKNSRGDLENELFDGYVTDAVSDDEEDKEWQSENINQIFNTCDFDRCGYLDKDKLQRICPHLNSNEIDLIFSNLDTNKDNKISLSEFSRGFKALLSEYVSNEFSAKTSSLNHKYSSSLPSMSVTNEYSRLFSNDKQDVHSQVNEVLDDLACQEQVFEFYDILRNGDAAESVEQFRNILEIFVRDISKYQQETKRLEEAYKREKENHDKYLKHIEEDYEREMRLLEENTRQEEKEKFDQEREYLRQKSAKEISDLQSMIQRMQTIEERYTEMKTGEDSAMLSLRNEILKLTQENQTLNSSLNESITSIAILKSDLSAMKGHLNDRQNLLLQ